VTLCAAIASTSVGLAFLGVAAQHPQFHHFVGWSPALFPISGQNPTSLGLKFNS
jgi:hypothetical protein